jgi:predicted enzyme related to lactoylglutathione lyase
LGRPLEAGDQAGQLEQGEAMPHPVIHSEIRTADPDATREFFGALFGWAYSPGAFPGYTFADVGVEGALPTAIGPLQGGD